MAGRGANVVEQADVCQDAAQAVIGLREAVLQRQGALEFRNGFQMLKVFRRAP